MNFGIGVVLMSSTAALAGSGGGGGGGGTTFNPADASGVTLSNGNLTAANTSGSYGGARATSGKSAGKWYFEFLASDVTDVSCFGIANLTAPFTNYLGSDANAVSGLSTFNGIYFNGAFQANTPTIAATNVIGVAVDIPNQLIWVAVNNVWGHTGGSGDPGSATGGVSFAGLTGTVYPAYVTKNGNVTARFVSGSQTYAAPTGYTAWG